MPEVRDQRTATNKHVVDRRVDELALFHGKEAIADNQMKHVCPTQRIFQVRELSECLKISLKQIFNASK